MIPDLHVPPLRSDLQLELTWTDASVTTAKYVLNHGIVRAAGYFLVPSDSRGSGQEVLLLMYMYIRGTIDKY